MPAASDLARQKACSLARYIDDETEEMKNLLILLFPFSNNFLQVKPGIFWVCNHCGANLIRNAKRGGKGRRWEVPTVWAKKRTTSQRQQLEVRHTAVTLGTFLLLAPCILGLCYQLFTMADRVVLLLLVVEFL